METFYAPAERATQDDLEAEVRAITESPVLTGLLQMTSGLLAILDEHRQIVALNDSLLRLLGVADPREALGLRLGEALACVHAHDEPAGCGTTRFCSSCGAAIAIVTSLADGLPAERMCALTAVRGDRPVDLALRVRSTPIDTDGRRLLLVFVQDVTVDQQRAALVRTFFHDVNNMVSGLIQGSELLKERFPSRLTNIVADTATRLHREIAIQASLLTADEASYHPTWKTIRVSRLLVELNAFFETHPVAKGKKVLVLHESDSAISTDVSALCRVLSNMVINALEATVSDDPVRVWAQSEGNVVRFSVWNRASIQTDVARRIFQRNFSTKAEEGRGVGTYSMKLFGEEILGGQVGFESSVQNGTTFWLKHPVHHDPPA